VSLSCVVSDKLRYILHKKEMYYGEK
jgi:hypothetical protein